MCATVRGRESKVDSARRGLSTRSIKLLFDQFLAFIRERLLVHEIPHRTIRLRQVVLRILMAKMLDKNGCNAQVVSKPDEVSEFVQVLPHEYEDKANFGRFTLEPSLCLSQIRQVIDHAVEAGINPDSFVGFWGCSINRHMNAVQPGRDTSICSTIAEQCQVRVCRDSGAPLRRVFDHVEKAGMHQRFAQSLEMQVGQRGKLVNQGLKQFPFHEGRCRRTSVICPILDWTHLALQVALTDWLNLDVFRQFHHAFLSDGSGFVENVCLMKLNFQKPTSRQNTASGGMITEVRTISDT